MPALPVAAEHSVGARPNRRLREPKLERGPALGPRGPGVLGRDGARAPVSGGHADPGLLPVALEPVVDRHAALLGEYVFLDLPDGELLGAHHRRGLAGVELREPRLGRGAGGDGGHGRGGRGGGRGPSGWGGGPARTGSTSAEAERSTVSLPAEGGGQLLGKSELARSSRTRWPGSQIHHVASSPIETRTGRPGAG